MTSLLALLKDLLICAAAGMVYYAIVKWGLRTIRRICKRPKRP